MDSFDDFEFKPLTEGLGFNKKPENRSGKGSGGKKKAARTSAVGHRSADSGAGSRTSSVTGSMTTLDPNSESDLLGRENQRDLVRDYGRDQDRHASLSDSDPLYGSPTSDRESKTISELIASLPPSMDFVEGQASERRSVVIPDIEPNLGMPDGGRPQIFQPFAREDFNAGVAPKSPHLPKAQKAAAIPAPTVGSAMAAGGMSAKLPVPGSKVQPATPSGSGLVAKVPSIYRERLNESFARAFPHAERKVAKAGIKTGPKANARATTVAKTEASKSLNKAQSTEGLEPIPAHFGAGFLDAMVVTGMSSILLVAIVAITHVNLYGLLTNVRTDGPTQVHIALLFLACLQLYFLTARSFFGASLGEWAFDLQLGSDEDQARAVYPLQIAWRTIFVTLTGLVIVPALSLLFRRDLAKHVSGAQLYVRRP